MRLIANGFAVETPPGWEDRSITTVVGPTGRGGFAPNVVVIRERVAEGTRLEDYARVQLGRTAAEIPGIAVVSERKIELHGRPAIERVHRFPAGGRSIQQWQIYLLGPGAALAITCSAQAEEFDACLAAFEQIVSSLRFFDRARVPMV